MQKTMPKLLLKKFMPDHEVIKNHKSLRFLGEKLHDPNFWHLSRRSISMAFAVGLFAAWIPVPGQMAIAALGAFYFRANLPVSIALVWITNPLTIPPLFYFAYRVGLNFLDKPLPTNNFEFSLDGVMSGLGDTWEPFLLGCLLMAAICSYSGHFVINYLWRRHVIKKWLDRKQRRALSAND